MPADSLKRSPARVRVVGRRAGLSKVHVPRRPSRKYLDALWSEVVKLRWENKSGISGRTGNLNAHHILGKPNNRLRYEVKNGIALTFNEHIHGIHNEGRREQYMERIIKAIGPKDYAYIKSLPKGPTKTDLRAVEMMLLNMKRELMP